MLALFIVYVFMKCNRKRINYSDILSVKIDSVYSKGDTFSSMFKFNYEGDIYYTFKSV